MAWRPEILFVGASDLWLAEMAASLVRELAPGDLRVRVAAAPADEDLLWRADVIVSIGPASVTPVGATKRYVDWPAADRDELAHRVRALLAELGG